MWHIFIRHATIRALITNDFNNFINIERKLNLHPALPFTFEIFSSTVTKVLAMVGNRNFDNSINAATRISPR